MRARIGIVIATLMLVGGCHRAEEPPKAPPTPAPVVHPKPVLTEVKGPDVHDRIVASHAPVVVVNVWATWCLPCREEMPDLLKAYRETRDTGVELILVSADFPEDRADVVDFLAKQGVDFPSYVNVGTDQQLISSLSDRWSGAIPATFVFDRDHRLRSFWQDSVDAARFEREIRAALEPPSSPAATTAKKDAAKTEKKGKKEEERP